MEQFITSRIRCYYELDVPHVRSATERSPLLIALHGFRGNKDSMSCVVGLRLLPIDSPIPPRSNPAHPPLDRPALLGAAQAPAGLQARRVG